jgi:hypothetical protein
MHTLHGNIQREKGEKLSQCLTKHHATKTHSEAKVNFHIFLILALQVDEWPVNLMPLGKELAVSNS